MSRREKAAKSSRPAALASDLRGRDLVACTDGPKAPQWFFLEDWKAIRTAAQRMGHTAATSPTLGYIGSGQTVPHPYQPVAGMELIYRPESPHAG